MEDVQGLMFVFFGFFAGLFMFYSGFQTFRRRQLIENTPTSNVRSIAMGLVEVYGEIVAKRSEALKSPFLNKSCVYYKYIIQEYKSSGKSGHWATIRSGNEGVPFLLKDETGSVLVNPKNCEADIPWKYSFSTGLGKSIPEYTIRFLEKQGVKHTGLFGLGKSLRFSEWYIPITKGTKLFVLGNAGDNPYVEDATSQMGHEDVMISKKRGSPFIISNKSEKKLLSNLGLQMYALITFGPLLSLGTLLIMLSYFNLI